MTVQNNNMANFSLPQNIALAITQIPGGLISFFSSASIINMILRSKHYPKSPAKRIMFFVSFYDMFQSLSSAMSALPAPKGMGWGSLGNEGTCSMQGFLFTVSTIEIFEQS